MQPARRQVREHYSDSTRDLRSISRASQGRDEMEDVDAEDAANLKGDKAQTHNPSCVATDGRNNLAKQALVCCAAGSPVAGLVQADCEPILAGCQTRYSSWTSRADAFEQVSRMNDLTIRIPYFEWRYWPDHVVHQGNYDHNTHSKLGRLGACRLRHPQDIKDQLHTLTAAASHK
jgi:hypothetical protein